MKWRLHALGNDTCEGVKKPGWTREDGEQRCHIHSRAAGGVLHTAPRDTKALGLCTPTLTVDLMWWWWGVPEEGYNLATGYIPLWQNAVSREGRSC